MAESTHKKSSRRGSRSSMPKPEVQSEARLAKALDLRADGLTFNEIGAQLKITGSGARKLVERALERLREENAEGRKHLRDIETRRLDRMLRALGPALREGEPEACKIALKIQERRAKLYGLDEPEKAEVKFEGTMDPAGTFASLMARLAAAASPGSAQPQRESVPDGALGVPGPTEPTPATG